jgi:hypothetical protein
MRHILRRREWVADQWRYLGEEAAPGAALIVPYAQIHADSQWLSRPGPWACAWRRWMRWRI